MTTPETGNAAPRTDIGARLRDAAARNDTDWFNRLVANELSGVESNDQLHRLTAQLLDDNLVEFIDAHPKALSPLAATWTQALLAVAFTENEVNLSPEYLELPPLFHYWKWRATNTGQWTRIRARVIEAAMHPGCPRDQRLLRYVSALFIDAMTGSLEDAIETFLSHPHEIDSGQARRIGRLLERADWFSGLADSLPAHIARSISASGPVARGAMRHPVTLLDLLGFARDAEHEWCRALFREIALPALHGALRSGLYDMALAIEHRIYNEYAKQVETSAHYNECLRSYAPAMAAAGQRVRATLPPLPRPPADDSLPVCGFLLSTGHVLAHTEMMMTLFRGLNMLPARPFEPRVYVFAGDDKGLEAKLRELHVPVIYLVRDAPLDEGRFSRLLRLRRQLVSDGVSAIVWMSVAQMLPMAYSIGMAPVQALWAMKYHPAGLPGVDLHLATGMAGEKSRTIDGQKWHTVPPAFADLYAGNRQPEAHRIRRELAKNYDVVLGSIGRPEKLDSEPFLDALARILERNPRAVFLWFGSTRPRGVRDEMERRGIAGRCLFQGWTDSRLYAQVLDIHLDTFPFPLGLTMFQTVAAGVPGVNFLSEESRHNGVLTGLLPLVEGKAGHRALQEGVRRILTGPEGENLLLAAHDVDEYVELVQKLIDEPAFRRQVGATGPKLVALLNRPQLMAQRFAAHVQEALSGALGS